MSRPLLTATLIARDEKDNVERCLDSIWPHVDQVVVADTGSKDGTIAALRAHAQKRKQPGKLKIRRYRWADDFAAARQAADELATGEWLVWADFDDTITGLDRLREYARDATDEVVGFFCRYTYATDPDGNAISELWRERVVRNDGNRWEGRLHEHKIFKGSVVKVPPEVAEWHHHRDHTQRTGERNLRILEAWDRDEPDNPRIVSSIGMELMGLERHKESADAFGRYLRLPGEPPDRRAQATRHMCVMMMIQGLAGEAKRAAFRSLRETWLWADSHLTLAEAAQTLGKPDEGLVHAQTALAIGQPDTLLIVNPLQYTAHPRALIAVCLAQMGRTDEAVRMCEEALQIAPSYQLAIHQLQISRGHMRKQNATGTMLALVEVLVETGELLKARALLDQAPWYVIDDPRIVERRVQLSHLIEERLGAPKAAVVDPAAAAFAERHMQLERVAA